MTLSNINNIHIERKIIRKQKMIKIFEKQCLEKSWKYANDCWKSNRKTNESVWSAVKTLVQ